MKHITTSLLALAVIFCANAQDEPTVTTGALFPVDHNVYNPAYYENVIQVSYDNEIVADNASVTLIANGVTTRITPSEISSWGFTLNLTDALASISENTQFSISITGVEPADETNDVVENISGTYLLRNSFPTAKANPAPGNLENVDTTVEVSFSESVEVADIFFMSGSFMNQKVNYAAGPEGYVSALNAIIEESYWSKTETPSNMQVRLGNVKINGGWIVPDYVFAYTHTFPAVTAKYLGYEPSNDEMTVWEVYGDGWGFVDFAFDAEVELTNENATAVVIYMLSDESVINYDVPSIDVWGDWSFWDGNYHLQIPLPYDASLTIENLIAIQVELQGIESNDTKINIPAATYVDSDSFSIRKARNNTAGIELKTADASFNIYNLQGVLVKENAVNEDIRSLVPGFYLVNGKKILVRK